MKKKRVPVTIPHTGFGSGTKNKKTVPVPKKDRADTEKSRKQREGTEI
jgi:hypothetical protein